MCACSSQCAFGMLPKDDNCLADNKMAPESFVLWTSSVSRKQTKNGDNISRTFWCVLGIFGGIQFHSKMCFRLYMSFYTVAFLTVNTPGGNPWRILSVKFHAMMYGQKMSGTVTNSIMWTHFVKCCWKIIGLVGNIIEWINFIHNNFIPSAWKNVLTPKQMVMTSKDHLKIWMLLTAQFSGKKTLVKSTDLYLCKVFYGFSVKHDLPDLGRGGNYGSVCWTLDEDILSNSPKLHPGNKWSEICPEHTAITTGNQIPSDQSYLILKYEGKLRLMHTTDDVIICWIKAQHELGLANRLSKRTSTNQFGSYSDIIFKHLLNSCHALH